ncbi:MAG: DUF349 domain-containing protein [Sphingobacteriaceae bacterium]|nr:DUF349 domain-containing protein [Sphingobacteriaceae bacterium]
MKAEIITKLEELLNKTASEVANDVRTLQKEYQKQWTTEFEQAKQAFLDEGGKAKEFVYEKNLDDQKITDLFEKHLKLKKEEDDKINREQHKNLIVRQEIIAKINDLSQMSSNVGAAIKMLQELQTQWKETGAVSSHKYKELQSEYSKVVENFYYNLKIFPELQEHDLKKNFELKEELLGKIKGIVSLENIKEAERLIKIYRNDWEEIGPVPNEKWDILKGEYRKALDEVYGKIKAFYNAAEELKEGNLQAKKNLVEKAKALLAESVGGNVGKWNETTNKLIEVQNEWKTIGRTTQKDNDIVWNEFKTICDDFFSKKKEYFNVVHEKQGEVKKVKIELIEKAEALQSSTDWQKTTQDLIRLQDNWKKQHLINEREEGKLFFRFRKACNTFFDAKKAHLDAQGASQEGNVKGKEEIVERINAFTLGEDASENVKALKQFSVDWNSGGQIPFKDRKRLNELFYNKLDELYEKLNLTKNEKIILQFKNKLERLLLAENAKELLQREADFLKKQIDEVQNAMKTYENNLGFFKNAKKDNPLLKEVNEKIDAEKQKISDFTAKRKLVVEEMNKLRAASEKKAETA